LDPNAAICSFVAEIDGKKVVGEVKEKKEARETYDDAIAEGHGTPIFLLFLFFILFFFVGLLRLILRLTLTQTFKILIFCFDC
jgi:uncharacterized membrane protein required for colicin V production